ncbi:acetyl-CoA acetyltransferase-like [Humulus lupulus]|uniref:acetyl-CoA acetyltransferase-like n=1 Tax=Humulus lupulus TaxID=3486 RepID=UPI002B40E3F6|nr:acetyl-CoA acetyltransferase-like [Humulus lupulus]
MGDEDWWRQRSGLILSQPDCRGGDRDGEGKRLFVQCFFHSGLEAMEMKWKKMEEEEEYEEQRKKARRVSETTGTFFFSLLSRSILAETAHEGNESDEGEYEEGPAEIICWVSGVLDPEGSASGDVLTSVKREGHWDKMDSDQTASSNLALSSWHGCCLPCCSRIFAFLVLVSGEKALQLGLQVIAKIKGYADSAQAPEFFTTAPALVITKAISNAGLDASQIDYYEINAAFSESLNVHGGAVSLGHPLGCSGACILVTLLGVIYKLPFPCNAFLV